MDSNYSKVLQRLSTYRKSLNKTQAEMGEQFGIDQSHYWKIESGSKRISYKSLKCFEEQGGDVSYLITGVSRNYGKMDELVNSCRTKEGKRELLEVMLWAINQGIRLNHEIERLSPKSYRSLKLLQGEDDSGSIWENIRKVEGISQTRMAEILDINIKRYRRIEKMLVYPDAEILNTLYCELEYSPLAILDAQLYYLDEMNYIWERFPDTIKSRLDVFLQKALDLVIENESDCNVGS